ncbi:MAG: arsenate reductase family protein [Pyrinomonadaceae bacterium]
MKNAVLYWLPHCSTCQKAERFLKSQDVEISDYRSIKENHLSRDEIEKLAEKVGGVNEVFSRRAIKYREMKLNERELSETEMLDLMTSQYTFIKRPVLVFGKKAIAGFSEKKYKEFLQ